MMVICQIAGYRAVDCDARIFGRDDGSDVVRHRNTKNCMCDVTCVHPDLLVASTLRFLASFSLK